MLRALLVIGVVLVGLGYSWKGPFYALLFYLWIAYFRPESWLWVDFVSVINLSFIVGVLVLFSTVVSQTRLRGGATTLLMLLFLAQGMVSALASPHAEIAWPLWQVFAKTIVISCLIVTLVTDVHRLRLTLLVIAVSLGFEGAKQGWAHLLLGGQNDNPIPMLGDNNGVAVGMLMLVPVLLALAATTTGRLERWIHRFVAVGVLYRAIATYSRGGFVACGALGLHYLARSRRKVVSVLTLVFLGLLIVPALPEAFWDRMQTIQVATETPEEADKSIRGRWHFWRVALVMMDDRPLLGVGHNAYNAAYDAYDNSEGAFGKGRSVHSSWLGVGGEQGYLGLIIFLLLIGLGFRACWRAQRLARTNPACEHLGRYASAIEAGLVVFCVGGTFLPWQYCEMLWHTLALSAVLSRLVDEHAPAPVPAFSSPAAAAIALRAISQNRSPLARA